MSSFISPLNTLLQHHRLQSPPVTVPSFTPVRVSSFTPQHTALTPSSSVSTRHGVLLHPSTHCSNTIVFSLHPSRCPPSYHPSTHFSNTITFSLHPSRCPPSPLNTLLQHHHLQSPPVTVSSFTPQHTAPTPSSSSVFTRHGVLLHPSTHCSNTIAFSQPRLVGLVVRRPPRERKIPGLNPAGGGIFSGSSHTSDLNIGTPVATLPGAWCYWVSAGTGWPGVSIL